MTAGRKPLPIEIHKLNGNPSKMSQEDLNKGELEVSSECPEPPAELMEDKDAQEEWNRIVPDLHQAGIIKKIDRVALAQYCIYYSEWITALRSIRRSRLIRNKNGSLTLNPSFKIMKDTAANIQKLLSEFGMTPSSRVRLRGNGKSPGQDPLDDEIFGDD